jgi:ADP-heptose:LPS heptosyltransferase
MFCRDSGKLAFPQMAGFSSNAQLLQKIDGSLGVLACFFATRLRRIIDLFSPTPEKSAPKNVLFLKLAEQGSTVLAHEAIRQAVERFGAKNVYFLLFEENRFILDLLGLVPHENVLTIRTKSPWQMVTSCLSRLWEIHRMGIEACIDMEFFARSTAALAWLTGARVRAGFHGYFGEGPYRGDLLTHRVLYNSHLHTSSTFTSLVMALDCDPEKFPTFPVSPPASVAPPMFEPRADERAVVEKMLRDLRTPGCDRLILLNANASDLLPLRKWNENNYVELARRVLVEFDDVCIGFTGAPEEAGKVGELVGRVGSPRCFCLAGKTTLRQLLIVYGMAEVLVTNDSGPAHFATLTSMDVVTLFGPETPLLFGAPTPRNHSLWAGIACSPCVNALNNRQTVCRDNVCMKMITVDQVFATVCRVHRQRRNQPA